MHRGAANTWQGYTVLLLGGIKTGDAIEIAGVGSIEADALVEQFQTDCGGVLKCFHPPLLFITDVNYLYQGGDDPMYHSLCILSIYRHQVAKLHWLQ
jgi:hypothetical protein